MAFFPATATCFMLARFRIESFVMDGKTLFT